MNIGDIDLKDYNVYPPLNTIRKEAGLDPVKKEFAKETAGKAKLTLVPRKIIWAIARVREYGNEKYPTGGPDNWKTVDDQDYRDAAFRHFLRYLDDPDSVDKESGISHLDHLACNIAFLIEKREERKEQK